jgi:hypothetical protein
MNDEGLSGLFDRLVPDPPRDLSIAVPRSTQGERRGRGLVLASAVGVALVVVGVAVLVQHGSSTTPPPFAAAVDCPATVDLYHLDAVPGVPSVDGAEHSLVPAKPAVQAFVCKYSSKGALLGQREMSNPGLMSVDLRLPKAPRELGCSGVGHAAEPYLLQLRYSDGVVWIADAGYDCVVPTNGRFKAFGGLAEDAAVSYDAGVWTNDETNGPCYRDVGRQGQEDDMVPADPVSVDVCAKEGTSVTAISSPDAVPRLIELVNTPKAHEETSFCGGGPTRSVELLFRYAEGRSVGVSVLDGCQRGGNTVNGSLVATLSDNQVDEVFRLAQ